MFKSKVTTLIMLIGVACSSVFLGVSEHTQGRGTVWALPTILSIVGLVVVLYVRMKKKN